jgi:hypothetical protein
MDFIFEDEVDEVGSDVEAYCPKCKADTTHVVISKYEDEIRRVQCNPCGDVHSFRKPRGEAEEDVPEPVSARKRALVKKQTWEEFFSKRNSADAKPYEFRELYRENLIVNHPKFGVGFVSEVVSDSKVEITFKDARRILVHNRRDIPGLPLAAEGDGTPTPPKDGAKAASKATGSKQTKEVSRVLKEHGKEPPREAQRDSREAGKEVARKGGGKESGKEAGREVRASAKTPAKAIALPAKTIATAEPKGKAAVKSAPKAARAAAPRGGKTAAKSAAKKPAAKPVKKAGKKR